MSNCLEIRNEVVVFTSEDIDVPALKKLVDESKESDKDLYTDPIKYLVQWFLFGNTTFTENGVSISFGRGQSSHTFRDFRGTINTVLKPLMKRSKVHNFTARDVENPQEGWFTWSVDFKQVATGPGNFVPSDMTE